jgi:uncharacterized protein YqgV (UPF0045/DUF77 family)
MASAEFLVEPFTEGELGPHVQAALDAFTDLGLPVDVGAFGNAVSGDPARVISGIESAIRRSVDAGATRVTVDFRVER